MPFTTQLSTRANVILAITAVQQGASLTSLLDTLLASVPTKDKGFAHELTFGVLRQWYALTRISGTLCKRPIDNAAVLATLHVGIYQLLYMRVPDHAAIGESVAAVKQVGEAHAASLVNAVLRRIQREQHKWAKKVVTKHSLPNWLAKRLKADWQADYDALSACLREPAPVFLRVNKRQIDQAGYLSVLHKQGIAAEPSGAYGVRLLQAARIDELPLYETGGFSVQDAHAQYCAELFSELTDKCVLDACAAPGGKTAQLLERYDCKLTAIDIDSARLLKVSENLERLQLFQDDLEIHTADAASYKASAPFDAILLDAPCTATGVIRRHPDINLLRTEADVAKVAALQARILDNLWQNLNVGGELVYVTCSLLKQENDVQITKFLARTKDAKEEKISLPTGAAQEVGWQCLPTCEGGDGFYFAKLIKL